MPPIFNSQSTIQTIFNFQFPDKPGFPLGSNPASGIYATLRPAMLVRVSIQPVTLTESNCQVAKNEWL